MFRHSICGISGDFIYLSGSRSIAKAKSISGGICKALAMALVTGIFAQIRIFLPGTPVPITCQTMAVIISGMLLGKWWGGISQSIYLLAGVIGMPWFSGWKGGLDILMGPTGGYIVGFIPASMVMGEISSRAPKISMFHLMMAIWAADILLIYFPGLLYMGNWIYRTSGVTPSLSSLLKIGFIPFVFIDLGKIVFCITSFGLIGRRKREYGAGDEMNCKGSMS